MENQIFVATIYVIGFLLAIHLFFQWTRRNIMLETIAIILIVLWLLGLVSSYTLGGFIHILLVIALVVILVRVIKGRRI